LTLTGKLWDTENGDDFGDELNLVEPGFNSGWSKVQGTWTLDEEEGMTETAPLNPENGLLIWGEKENIVLLNLHGVSLLAQVQSSSLILIDWVNNMKMTYL